MCQEEVTRIYNRMNSISQHISRIRHNKANTNVFITLMTKISDTAEAKYKYEKELSEAEQGATGTSTG